MANFDLKKYLAEGKLTNEGILNEESRPEPGTAYDFDQESMKQFEKFIQDNIENYIENLVKSTRWFLFKAGEGRSPSAFDNALKALNNLDQKMKSSDYGPYNFSDYELSKRKSN